MTKKKNVISPLFTHSPRVCDSPVPPSQIDSGISHTAAYDAALIFDQASAIRVAASRKAALPDSVRRKARSGVSRLRAHAVRPVKGPTKASGSVMV